MPWPKAARGWLPPWPARRARKVLGALAVLLGLGVLLSALPAWLWVAAAGTALLVWGLALLLNG